MTGAPSAAAQTTRRPRVIYIAGAGHSGSTLLELLLGSHSRVAGLGELKVLAASRAAKRSQVLAEPCTCGAPNKAACPFWSAVEQRVSSETGRSLSMLDPAAPDDLQFATDNEELLRAAWATADSACGERGGLAWLVDSSKNPARLRRLRASGRVEVFAIGLTRDPRGVVHSNLRKGRGLLRTTARHLARTRALRRALRGQPHHAPHYALRYEDLASEPETQLARLMDALGLPFESGQLDWTAHTHHILNGNRKRFSNDPRIELDERWRSGLTRGQRILLSAVFGRERTS